MSLIFKISQIPCSKTFKEVESISSVASSLKPINVRDNQIASDKESSLALTAIRRQSVSDKDTTFSQRVHKRCERV